MLRYMTIIILYYYIILSVLCYQPHITQPNSNTKHPAGEHGQDEQGHLEIKKKKKENKTALRSSSRFEALRELLR